VLALEAAKVVGAARRMGASLACLAAPEAPDRRGLRRSWQPSIPDMLG
jgi:hypothetical protein